MSDTFYWKLLQRTETHAYTHPYGRMNNNNNNNNSNVIML